jgi:WG repeat protein
VQKRAVVGLCRTLAVFVVGLSAFLNSCAVAEERLYPHAEQVSGPWGYVDKSGRAMVSPQFDWAEPFSEGRAAVVLNKKHGYIDGTGRLVIALQFDVNQSVELPSFQSGHAVVRDGNQMRLIDRDGSIIAIDRPGAVIMQRRYVLVQPELPGYRKLPDEDRIIVFSGGKDGKYGVIDLSGRMIVQPEYKRMEPFSEGLAAVSQGDKVGFIDNDGKLVVPFELDGYSTYFRDGR